MEEKVGEGEVDGKGGGDMVVGGRDSGKESEAGKRRGYKGDREEA